MRGWIVASVVRIVLACAMGVSLLAVVVGCLCPDEERGRTRVAPSIAIIETRREKTGYDLVPTLLDADEGRAASAAAWVGKAFTSPTLSPWRDERGRKQVVGFSWDGIAKGERRHERRFGILLARYPGGETLSFAPLDSSGSLGGPLCWLPGTLARVLFAGRDGSLYRIDFERLGADKRIERLDPPAVLKIGWQASLPTGGVVNCDEPAWSSDSRWGGRVIVVLRHAAPPSRELTPSASLVVEAQRLEHGDRRSGARLPRFRTRLSIGDGSGALSQRRGGPGSYDATCLSVGRSERERLSTPGGQAPHRPTGRLTRLESRPSAVDGRLRRNSPRVFERRPMGPRHPTVGRFDPPDFSRGIGTRGGGRGTSSAVDGGNRLG